MAWPLLFRIGAPDAGGYPRRQERRWQEALRKAVEAIAGLTAVDGATILSDDYELLAFGAKITRRDGLSRSNVLLRSSLSKARSLARLRRCNWAARGTCPPRSLRRTSATRWPWCFAGRPFTIFAWSPREQVVHAHRVEALLL